MTLKNVIFLILFLITFSCSDKNESADDSSYSVWTQVGNGLSADVTKNVLTEFVGSTNCPVCPASDSLLLSYFNDGHENYVGAEITQNWFLLNYHTYSPSRGDPIYEFLRGESETGEDDYCYVRFEEGSWYTIYGVPTTFTNGTGTSIYPEMAVAPMAESTPIQMSLSGTEFDGANISVKLSIKTGLIEKGIDETLAENISESFKLSIKNIK